jgi:hypothetical protein
MKLLTRFAVDKKNENLEGKESILGEWYQTRGLGSENWEIEIYISRKD